MDFLINSLVPEIKKIHWRLYQIITILSGITDLPTKVMLCTLDIKNFYTNMPHQEGMKAIQEILAIQRASAEIPHNNYKVELLKEVLENSYFDFSGRHYHQNTGSAKLITSLAKLFMSNFEYKCVYLYPQQLLSWKSSLMTYS